MITNSENCTNVTHSSANLVNPDDLTPDAVVLSACATGPLVSWHVHTHHMLIFGKILGKRSRISPQAITVSFLFAIYYIYIKLFNNNIMTKLQMKLRAFHLPSLQKSDGREIKAKSRRTKALLGLERRSGQITVLGPESHEVTFSHLP